MNDLTVAGAKLPGVAGAYIDNAAALVRSIYALASTAIGLAGTAQSGTIIKGKGIALQAQAFPQSAQVCFPIRAVLASGHTLTLLPAVQDSDTDVDGAYAAYGDAMTAQVLTANDDGSAIETELRVNVDLSAAKLFVRFNITPTLSTSGVDSARLMGVAAMVGGDRLASPVETSN